MAEMEQTDNGVATPEANQTATETPAEKADPLAEARAQAAKLAQENKDLNDRRLRLAADFENYKKRARKEMEEAGVRGMEALLKDLLPVLDNLDRALQIQPGQSSENMAQAVLEGVRLVQKQFLSALEKFQVRPFDAQGKPFDPQYHEAVQQLDNPSLPPGTVATVYQRGYTAGNRLLRPAMVAVVRGRSEAASGASPASLDVLDLDEEKPASGSSGDRRN